MKKNKIIIICVLAIFIITCTIVIGIKLYKDNKNKNIMISEENQVIILEKLYKEFIGDTMEKANVDILLDDSTIKNAITRQYFSDASIEKLKELEIHCENPKETYTLYVKAGGGVMELTLKSNKGDFQIQKYELYVQNESLEYRSTGEKMLVVS